MPSPTSKATITWDLLAEEDARHTAIKDAYERRAGQWAYTRLYGDVWVSRFELLAPLADVGFARFFTSMTFPG